MTELQKELTNAYWDGYDAGYHRAQELFKTMNEERRKKELQKKENGNFWNLNFDELIELKKLVNKCTLDKEDVLDMERQAKVESDMHDYIYNQILG